MDVKKTQNNNIPFKTVMGLSDNTDFTVKQRHIVRDMKPPSVFSTVCDLGS